VEPESDQVSTGSNARFRYGSTLVLTVVLLLFLIAAPPDRWTGAVALAIEGGLLIAVAVTSRESSQFRHRLALAYGFAMALFVALAAADILPESVVRAIAGLLTALVFVALLRGVARLIRQQGVTAQAVAGALTIYLLVGLTFAWTIAVIVQVTHTPYFAQVKTPSTSDIVYFSFTTLTTTGFGDLTPATRGGRAVTVLEMVTGQIYLVTVVGILIGSFVGRRGRQ
jgi:hypothetical protein